MAGRAVQRTDRHVWRQLRRRSNRDAVRGKQGSLRKAATRWCTI